MALGVKTEKKESRKRGQLKTYAFIDSQNLNLGTSKDIFHGRKLIYKGWKLDFKKFRRYLLDKFRVNKAILFIGYIKKMKDFIGILKALDTKSFLNLLFMIIKEIRKEMLMQS